LAAFRGLSEQLDFQDSGDLMAANFNIVLDFPVHSSPRYGWGRPAHAQLSEIIGAGRADYAALLTGFLEHRENLTRIPRHQNPTGSTTPFWINGSLPGLDAVSLYCLLARYRPRRYYEVGVGNSTLFARRCIDDLGLQTELVGVDPYAQNAGTQVCTRLVREPLEQLDPAFFDALQAGDMLFIDNSHRVFMNSDATVFFLDILPRLKSGVVVGIHDIALPWDYPPEWVERYYSEQYLLAAYLLARGSRFRILLPNAFVSLDPDLVQILAPLWSDPALNGEFAPPRPEKLQTGSVETHGSLFWLVVN
jgi:hypothetical protein